MRGTGVRADQDAECLIVRAPLPQVEVFLSESTDKLAVRPQSVEDIAIAQRYWRDIDASREALRAKSRGLVDVRVFSAPSPHNLKSH